MTKVFIFSCIWGAAVFFLQKLLFEKTSKRILHFIPLMIIGAVYTVSIILWISELYVDSGFLFHTLLGWILAGLNTTALVADGIAWLIEKV